jgi:hypothetical protein
MDFGDIHGQLQVLRANVMPYGRPIHTDDDIGLQGRADHNLDIHSKGPSGVFCGQNLVKEIFLTRTTEE